MSARYDALVIGGSIGGLAAAACLADKGVRVLLLEAEGDLGEPAGPLYALDPVLVHDLRLLARGLRFVHRDLPLAGMGSLPMVLGRDPHDTTRILSCVSDADAAAWPAFRRELFAQARALRRWWWQDPVDGAAQTVLESRAAKQAFARLCLTGADAWTGAHFESEALISALLWDATAGGLAVSEPGSALALVWRAAQEMAGLQGATAIAEPGTLLSSLMRAADTTQIRLLARVARITQEDGAVTGVRLADGETIAAPVVISGLTRAATQALLGQPSGKLSALGEARIVLQFAVPHGLAPARYILTERADIYADAHEEARMGQLPAELPLAFTPVAPDKVVVTARPVPAILSREQRAQLAARAVVALGRHAPASGLARRLVHAAVTLSPPRVRATLAQLEAPAAARIVMPQAGLYLAGDDAEPLPCVSGRAGRIAAAYALRTDAMAALKPRSSRSWSGR